MANELDPSVPSHLTNSSPMHLSFLIFGVCGPSDSGMRELISSVRCLPLPLLDLLIGMGGPGRKTPVTHGK